MSIFQCSRCGCVENTACCSYHYQVAILKILPECSACSDIPKAGTNKCWHGKFERIFLPKGMFITDRYGNLIHKETKETDYRKYRLNPEESGENTSISQL